MHPHPRPGAARRRLALVTCLACALAVSGPVRANTWIEQAQSDLLCIGHAPDAERRAFEPLLLPQPLTGPALSAWLQGKPRDARHAAFRQLVMLAAVDWWADRVNDPTLRNDVRLDIGAHADRHVARRADDVAFRQIARCARTHLISVAVERERLEDAEALAANLAGIYPDELPANAAEDWPLVLALGELVLEPRARNAIALLATRTANYAGAAQNAGQAARASRLYAATAQALLALGDAAKARDLALQALAVSGRPPAPDAAWVVMPTLFDAVEQLSGPGEAATLQALLNPPQPPPTLRNNRAAFDALLRLARAAETREQYDDWSRLLANATGRLADLRALDRLSLPFYRSALDELAAGRDPNLGLLATHDPEFGSRTLAAYADGNAKLLAQAQNQFVADAREQAYFQYRIDNGLHALASLYPAMPRQAAAMADATFGMAQLRSYGRLTLATLSAELDRSGIDPRRRQDVERFFAMATQSGAFLRTVLNLVRTAPDAPPPDGAALWQALTALDVYQEESTRQYGEYVRFVREHAPGVAALATPRPLPAREFQRRLLPGEAVLATLVTPRDLYVWAVTPSAVTFVRQPFAERDVAELVRRLRAGLIPASAGGATELPPFDAAAAHEIHQLVFAPVAAALNGITDITWYGHGPLGAVPPAVLVSAPPASPTLRTPAEFAATEFLVDRYAFSTLADLSLFVWHRDQARAQGGDQRFLGVGAPMLSAEELAGAPRPRSYELAGALDGKALAELPKLAESVDEMKAIAGIVGTENATLWLGPDAREERFAGDSLRGYRTIALATHGFLSDEVEGLREPSLMLALAPDATDRYDGLLTATEIAGLALDAELVILSACNTAANDGRPRAETFTGLTQAFFAAGARSLMVSHWPVMSGAAVQLSVGTMDRTVGQGLPLARSLQQSMQAARRDGAGNPLEAHPSYWGPFVVVGDGR